jgi:hypothetical protein
MFPAFENVHPGTVVETNRKHQHLDDFGEIFFILCFRSRFL